MDKVVQIDKQDKKWITIFLGIILFCIFYVLKILGYWDYTSKYGIEYIQCAESYNKVLMIDGDNKTTWGRYCEFTKGDKIDFKFKSDRSFSRIELSNYSEQETIPVNIYISNDGIDYELCSATRTVYENYDEYNLENSYDGEYLRLEYDLDAEMKWPITEIYIYE